MSTYPTLVKVFNLHLTFDLNFDPSPMGKGGIKILISKYGASMAKESAQKGNLYVSQLNSHWITLNSTLT